MVEGRGHYAATIRLGTGIGGGRSESPGGRAPQQHPTAATGEVSRSSRSHCRERWRIHPFTVLTDQVLEPFDGF
ncbi:MAG: hypothetical protein ABI680_13525, partial [Chthoniobacteraceae bacterium]